MNKSSIPAAFIPNHGQENMGKFLLKASDGKYYFDKKEIQIVVTEPLDLDDTGIPKNNQQIRWALLKLNFVNPDDRCELYAEEPDEAKYHYFRSSESSQWIVNVSAYHKLRYKNIWNGIDLEVSCKEEGVKFNWILDTPALADRIQMEWQGFDEIGIEDDGSLHISHHLGTLIDAAPVAWQTMNGINKSVASEYVLNGSLVTFSLSGEYDAAYPVTIDPMFQYCTFLGGAGDESGRGIAVDDQGCAYVTGWTPAGFPVTPGVFQGTTGGGIDAFIAKFSEDGSSLLFSSYLGGSGNDFGYGVQVDSNREVYLTGNTASTDFPVTAGAFQTTYQGGANDAFLTKVSSDGSQLIYSTYIGGSGDDGAFGVVLDVNQNPCVVGRTGSSNFPVTAGAFQTSYGGGTYDAFAVKLNSNGSSLIYSTFIGGSGTDVGWFRNAIDSVGRVYLTGYTSSSNFPTTPGAYQTSYSGGSNCIFVTKLSPDGSAAEFSTYIGGSENDVGEGVYLSSEGDVFVGGYSSSADFPVTAGAYQTVYPGTTFTAAIISKLSPDGSTLLASTYLTGRGYNYCGDIIVDSRNVVHVTGWTNAGNFPITPAIIPSSFQGVYDAFISSLSSDLSQLLVSYYVGGSQEDNGRQITIDRYGRIYTAGDTKSSNFPVTAGAYQTVLRGSRDAYVTKSPLIISFQRAAVTIVKIS